MTTVNEIIDQAKKEVELQKKLTPEFLETLCECARVVPHIDWPGFHDIIYEIYFFAGKDPDNDLPNLNRYDGRNC